MSGGMLGIEAVTEPQGEPTTTPDVDESAPTPTAGPDETTEEGETDFESNDNALDNKDNAEEETGNTELSETPAPQPTPTAEPSKEPTPTPGTNNIHTDAPENNAPAQTTADSQTDYLEQIACMQETLNTLVQQNAQLIDLERTNGFFLTIILAVLLCHVFWRRILR